MKNFIFLVILFTTQVHAWGPTGHRAVGAVAEKFLDPFVAARIDKILGGNSLSRVSNWSDEIKSDPDTYSHTFNWHYTDWKDEDHQHDETNSSGKLLSAIKEQVNVLKDAQSPDEKKVFALKFIVHLIGDLHQPLHVGNGLDMGGNKCKVQFHRRETNLHALWDEGIIEFTKLSFSELANYVSQGRSSEEVRSWKEGDVTDWALESKILRASIYPSDITPSETPASIKQYCRSDIVVTSESMPKLGYEYSYKFVPVLERRIFQAGLRLAVVLNNTFK
jgi:hypothetical protein